ncbi:MAG: S8 family peptidase [Liquorilactobacillus hordei]|uniref:S8 family peptidase n=1 Tax=Liquorilactobacillus hordei TaxID=468911 RepID=UPI0039EB293A
MNDILQLKGNFEQRDNHNGGGGFKLSADKIITVHHLESLISDLNRLISFWKTNTLLPNALVSVYYNKVVAKSNRISRLLKADVPSNESIVGAKFWINKKKHKHIITHYVPLSALNKSIQDLRNAINVLTTYFNGEIDTKTFNEKKEWPLIPFENYYSDNYTFPKSAFENIIVDTSYVECFDLTEFKSPNPKESIVTLYDTNVDIIILLKSLGISITRNQTLNNTTVLLDENYLQILFEKAPYLVSMATEDMSKLDSYSFQSKLDTDGLLKIPDPTNEPVIGVIDTQFANNVYFSKWVDFTSMIDPNIQISDDDYKHGTNVTSIIVDGPTLNPKLDDGLGRFKVKHYGVALANGFSSFSIIRQIKSIVLENPSIHVWNLSLGSKKEINDNFISAEGAELDRIQFEHDVLFVIAGTNKKNEQVDKKIGAPADSLNSLVVNSVDFDGQPASYTRKGLVLSFFAKPDISYYGGVRGSYMNVVDPLGLACVAGTSFAAPWISRKVAYLIEVLGISKEVAKALIIDSAIGWEKGVDNSTISLKGYGVVPQRIDDIVRSKESEIKFLVSGTSEKYDTFNYNFPVPMENGKYPFVAKATLVYFPKTSRNQGVDYTNTELDIKFGRIKDNGKISDINGNTQTNDGSYILEEDARGLFRKWDNVKHIGELLKSRTQPRQAYSNPNWGMSIKTKERLNTNDGEGIHFGVVVTLREINGKNRIDDFIQQASLKGWLVNRLSVQNQIEIYHQAEEHIELE